MPGRTVLWRGTLYAYAPLILWIGVIFFLSSGSGSMAATSKIIRPLLEFLFPAASEESLQLMHFYIRKCAHFTEYGILALWAVRAFRRSSVRFVRDNFYFTAALLVAVIAISDETYQSFNASRTSSVYDMLLDFSGGIFAIIVHFIITRKKKGVPEGDKTI